MQVTLDAIDMLNQIEDVKVTITSNNEIGRIHLSTRVDGREIVLAFESGELFRAIAVVR